MYLTHPKNFIQALDARNGDVLWEYRRHLPAGTISVLRNIAIYDDKLIIATADAHLLALDARKGDVVWETRVGDYKKFSHTSGPIVAKGKVFTGRSCLIKNALPGGCFIAAHDVNNGKELWRRYLIPRPGEPGDESWGGLPMEKRIHLGAWGVGSFDGDLNLLYWGTSVPAPTAAVHRGTVGHDLLYANSTLALDGDTGEIVWYFQHLPRPNWDLDHTFERILVDSELRPNMQATWEQNPRIQPGAKCKLMTGIPGKTGIVWTLDRATGEFLWAKETVQQNVIRGIDSETGRVTVNESLIPKHMDEAYDLACPSPYGGK